ncbi:MAG: hypothetical protein K8F91_16340 [Candidatus Obscuribacterales bacterium]|nr:hypothetical protein [Candidatus Obscuribacterales bacterium]
MSQESSNVEQPPQSAPATIPRLGFWPNLLASYKLIREAVQSEGKKIRKSDPLTIWLVPGLAFALLAVSFSTGALRLAVAILAYFSALLYIAARIGIVRSMNHRQVNLVWHIILCSFLAGVLFSFVVLHLVQNF